MSEPAADKRAALRDLTVQFLTTFGARLEPAGGDELVAHLPPDLAAHFGKPVLHLTFSAVEISPFEDLVVYSSRTFARIMAWLNKRGEFAVLHLPAHFDTQAQETALPEPLTLVNATVRVRSSAATKPYALFNLRLTYTADDRSEELFTLVLDKNGELHPELQEAHRYAVDWPDQDLPLSAQAFQALAQKAVEYARAHAEERAAAIEAAHTPRRDQNLERLHTFYERRIQEFDPQNPEDEAIQDMLRDELERKVADELERYCVQVAISPVSRAVLTVPYRRYNLTLERPTGVSHRLSLEQNLHDGTRTPLNCRACGASVTALGLCDRGHVACATCLHTCAACGHDLCDACGIAPDPIGGEWVCADCAIHCTGCGRAFLPAHTALCAHCGATYCELCLETCPHCGKRFCSAHLTTCSICGARRCVEQGLICAPGGHPVCEAHHVTCPICDNGHCPTHQVTCAVCRQTVCPNCVDAAGVCQTCVQARHAALASWPELAQRTTWEAGYTWRVAQNRAWRVYYGEKSRGPLHTWAVIVVALDGEAILYQHRQGVLESLVAWLTG